MKIKLLVQNSFFSQLKMLLNVHSKLLQHHEQVFGRRDRDGRPMAGFGSFSCSSINISLILKMNKDMLIDRLNQHQKNNYRIRAIKYNPRLVYLLRTPFLKTIYLFSRIFSEILSLCMVSIQERFVTKSGL